MGGVEVFQEVGLALWLSPTVGKGTGDMVLVDHGDGVAQRAVVMLAGAHHRAQLAQGLVSLVAEVHHVGHC